jgi:hypothetical protein
VQYNAILSFFLSSWTNLNWNGHVCMCFLLWLESGPPQSHFWEVECGIWASQEENPWWSCRFTTATQSMVLLIDPFVFKFLLLSSFVYLLEGTVTLTNECFLNHIIHNQHFCFGVIFRHLATTKNPAQLIQRFLWKTKAPKSPDFWNCHNLDSRFQQVAKIYSRILKKFCFPLWPVVKFG